LSFLIWIEQTGLSLWLRESPSLLAFPFVLFLHTLGLGILAGISVAIDLWLLTSAARSRAVSMTGFFQVMWLGFGINAVSGTVLLIAYPAKALTDPVFFIKMGLVLAAMINLEWTKKEVFVGVKLGEILTVSNKAKWLAGTSLAIWAGTILAGRLLAYTYNILLASDAL
jgi:hypothetical protein